MSNDRSEYVIKANRLPASENAFTFNGHEHEASVSFSPAGICPAAARTCTGIRTRRRSSSRMGTSASPSARRRSMLPPETSWSFPPGRRTSSSTSAPGGYGKSASTRSPGWTRSGWSREKYRPRPVFVRVRGSHAHGYGGPPPETPSGVYMIVFRNSTVVF